LIRASYLEERLLAVMALMQISLECFVPSPSFHDVRRHSRSFGFESKANLAGICTKPNELQIRREVRDFHAVNLFRSCFQIMAVSAMSAVLTNTVCGHSQYLSSRYIKRLAGAGNVPSLGSAGHSGGTARAETIDTPCKTERVILCPVGASKAAPRASKDRGATCRIRNWPLPDGIDRLDNSRLPRLI
jgi:hypothetical protein